VLVLTRKVGEQILIGDDIVVTVLDTKSDGLRIGIDAPRGLRIQRAEVIRAVSDANVAAARADDAAGEQIKELLRNSRGGTTEVS
jgi:carbon storage regulator